MAVAFYILAWPELLPGGRSLIARLDSTSAWILEFAQTFLVLAILAALLSRWPAEQHLRGGRWLGAVAGALGLVALACATIAWNEQRFPPLVAGPGLYTLLIQLWVVVLIILVAAEVFLTTRRYLARNELFLGYLAVGLLAFDFCLASAVLGTQRYDLLFYLSRVIGVYAVLVTLFGLLTEFPLLLHRERESLARVATEREWFQTTLASIGDAVITTDAQGRVSYLNAVAEELTGWRNQEASGLPVERVFKIVNEQSAQPASNPVEVVLQQGLIAGLTNHTALMTKGGLAVPIEDSAAPISGMPGRVLGVVLVFHDVSEKRKAERELMESEARFRVLADSNPNLIWVSDRLGNDMFVNRTYREYFGVTVEQVEGGKWQPLLHPEDRPAYVAAFMQAVQEQAPFRGEMRARRKDGEWRLLSNYAEPRFSESGEFLGHIGNSTDITEQQKYIEETHARTVQIELQRRLLDQREQERLQIARDLHDGPVQELTGATFALHSLILDQSSPEIAEQLEALQATLQDQINELRDYAGELRPPALSKFGVGESDPIVTWMTFQEKNPGVQGAVRSGPGSGEAHPGRHRPGAVPHLPGGPDQCRQTRPGDRGHASGWRITREPGQPGDPGQRARLCGPHGLDRAGPPGPPGAGGDARAG